MDNRHSAERGLERGEGVCVCGGGGAKNVEVNDG